MSHAEDMEISPWDYRLAEDIETVRNCWLSEYYQTPAAHVPCVHPGRAGCHPHGKAAGCTRHL